MKIDSASRLRGSVVTPGDKSISHRALMISALASGRSVIRGGSRGADVLATMQIMRQLGASIVDGAEIVVEGPQGGLRASNETLDCGNSGTTIRLLMGLLAGVAGTHRLDGDASLRSRPMSRVADPLEMMGVRFAGGPNHLFAPFDMSTDGHPLALNYLIPVPSAQVKSAILFASLAAESVSTVIEKTFTRANTEEMLVDAGISLQVSEHHGERTIRVSPGRPQRNVWQVPQDPSQAAFFVVAALVHPDANLEFTDIYAGAERNGYLDVLTRMGALIERENVGTTVNLRARSSKLQGTTIHSREIPSVDEVPILVVAAAAAEGNTAFMDMGELRIKESDRFANSVALAQSLGAAVEVDGDSFVVSGLGDSRLFQEATSSHPGDHRMTMATAISGVCGNGAKIDFPESVRSSFPTFFELLASLTS